MYPTATEWTSLLAMLAFAVSNAAAQDQGACCFPDNTVCEYLTSKECAAQGGNHLGPKLDCSFGVCCPGACCLPDQSCETLPFLECTFDQEGMWWGTILSCDQVDCGPREACCVGEIVCADVSRTSCLTDFNGIPQGFGTTCATDPCPFDHPRACCKPDGDCWNMTGPQDFIECMMQDGMPMDASCALSFCMPTEACCLGDPGDEECFNYAPFICSLSGGTPLGFGTTCSTTITCGGGACCLDGGACEVSTPLGCMVQRGMFISGESTCGISTCESQACCQGDDPCAGGYCEEVPLGYCVESGGTPLGPGSVCETGPCGPGACCLPDGSCEELSAVECLEQGGETNGPGSVCADATCRPFRAGACCLGPTECVITREESTCTDLGGSFLGFDTGCPTQTIEYISEPGGDVCNHAIVTVVDCPEPGGSSKIMRMAGPGPRLDTWTSPEDASMCHNFGVTESPPIPADFFGLGSDAYSGPVCLRGVPLGTVTLDEFGTIDVGQVDTVIRRERDPFVRCGLPSETPVTVSIEMAALNLEGVAPMIVSYNQGASFEFWSVTADLSSLHSDADSGNDPPVGSLTASRTHCNGGTYTSVLYVQPRFTFTNDANPAEVRVLDTGLEGIAPVMLDASSLPVAWVSDMHDSLGTMNPIYTEFHPGVSQDDPVAVCDCNGNLIRDKCDIENGFSVDCNANATPDSCDLSDGTSSDCNTNTVPDECDIAGGASLDCNATASPDECETIGGFDFDGNGSVDLEDVSAFTSAMSGPGATPNVDPPACIPANTAAFDADHDEDIDLGDFAAFQQSFGARP